MTFDVKDVRALGEGLFKLDSLHMRLEQNQAGGAVYVGPGRIDQDADKHLQFTLYAPDAPPLLPAISRVARSYRGSTSGPLRPRTTGGQSGRCYTRLVSPGWSGPGKGSIITERLPMLRGPRRATQGHQWWPDSRGISCVISSCQRTAGPKRFGEGGGMESVLFVGHRGDGGWARALSVPPRRGPL